MYCWHAHELAEKSLQSRSIVGLALQRRTKLTNPKSLGECTTLFLLVSNWLDGADWLRLIKIRRHAATRCTTAKHCNTLQHIAATRCTAFRTSDKISSVQLPSSFCSWGHSRVVGNEQKTIKQKILQERERWGTRRRSIIFICTNSYTHSLALLRVVFFFPLSLSGSLKKFTVGTLSTKPESSVNDDNVVRVCVYECMSVWLAV